MKISFMLGSFSVMPVRLWRSLRWAMASCKVTPALSLMSVPLTSSLGTTSKRPCCGSTFSSPATFTTKRFCLCCCLMWATLPSSTTRAWLISVICSHISSTLAMLWVENRMVAPSSRSCMISRFSCSAFTGSKPENGSSKMSSCGRDKLHLLLHALRELLHLAVTPLGEVEPLQPFLHLAHGKRFGHALEASQIHYLVGNLDFLVEAALLGQVANVGDVVLPHLAAVEQHRAAVGTRDAVDDAYERCLAGTVRPEQAIDATLWHMKIDMVERQVPVILLHHTINVNEIHNI